MKKEEFFNFLNNSIGCGVDIINRFGINKGIYSSSLLDLKDGVIGIAQPMYKGSWVQMFGMELVLHFKKDGNLIEAPVLARGTTFEGLLPIFWVELTGDVNKVQRRSFVRIPCRIEANCYFLEIYSDTHEAEPDDPKEWFPIIINNVSLGGIAATVKQGFQATFYKKGRYLLAIDLGAGVMFLNLLARNIFSVSNNKEEMSSCAFVFGGLSVYQDRTIGSFVRRLELSGK